MPLPEHDDWPFSFALPNLTIIFGASAPEKKTK